MGWGGLKGWVGGGLKFEDGEGVGWGEGCFVEGLIGLGHRVSSSPRALAQVVRLVRVGELGRVSHLLIWLRQKPA